jgi:hypothetical protein
MSVTRERKNYPETDTRGRFKRSTLIDMDSRLRVARAIEKDETVFRMLKQLGHPDGPPPTISDGWGGIDEAMVEVYGLVPEYSGLGCPPTRKKPSSNWQYLQMVKQRDQHGRFLGTKLRVIFGTGAEVIKLLGKSTAYIERSNLTSRLFNSRQVRKTSAFSKDVEAYRAAAILEDSYNNLVRPHKSLQLSVEDGSPRKWSTQTPGMTAGLTDHIWTVKELLTTWPLSSVTDT